MTKKKASDKPKTVTIAAEFLGRTLVEKCIEEMKALPKAWQSMSEAGQRAVLDRVKATVEEAVKAAIRTLQAEDWPTCKVHIKSMNIKEGASLTVGVEGDSMHQVLDYVGQGAIIVLSNPMAYLESMEAIKPEADQKQLDLEAARAPHHTKKATTKKPPSAAKRSPYDEALKLVTESKNCAVSNLQRELKMSYAKASALLVQLESAGVVSAKKGDGTRELITKKRTTKKKSAK